MIMRIPDLDLDLVRCFVTVVERGSQPVSSPASGLTRAEPGVPAECGALAGDPGAHAALFR